MTRRILTIDPKRTHERNPDCPMHLVPVPDGNWMCLDCGAYILMTSIELNPTTEQHVAPKGFGIPFIKPQPGLITERP